MSLKKITALAAVLFAVSALHAQRVTVKIASVAPSRSPWEIEQKNLAMEWSKITNGAVTLQFFDINVLGGESGVIPKMRAVRPGQKSPLDGAIFTSIGAYELAPDSNILTFSVPYLFRDQDELSYILELYSPEIGAAIEKQGFMLLGWFNVGWAYFFTKDEIRTPEHLKSSKLSVGGVTSPELGRAFQIAGYTTEDVPNEKIMQSAKTPNGIKGLYTIPMYAYAAQYYKSLPYIIETPLAPVMAAFVISKKTWESIPDQYKQPIKESVRKAEQKFIGVQKKVDGDYLKLMTSEGAILVQLSSSELKQWENVLSDDVKKMTFDPKLKVINFDFFSRIENDLKKIRK